MVEPTGPNTVSRRTVLKGMAGAAAVVSVPAIIAACNAAATPSPSAAAASAAASAAPSVAPSVAPSAAPASAAPVGTTSLGSNYSDPVPKKAMQDIVDAFTAKTGITVKVNTVDHGTFQNQISSYLQGTPDDVFTWFSGFRMRFFAAQGLAEDISDVWQSSLTANYSDAFKVGSTGDDGKQYFVPIYNYPWAIFYRKSLFADKGYAIPGTLDEFKALCTKMKADGLIPIAFADKDGWPAMGTFDIINLRTNGYDFHVGLMAGSEKWTDAKVKTVFETWKTILPFCQEGAAGRTWQDGAQALLQKKAGMYLLGMFVSQQFTASSEADLADLDFFPYPSFGNQYDAEKALDAPIDGFMIAKNAKDLGTNLDAAKALMEFLGTGEAQDIYVKSDPGNVAAAKDANTSNYNALQKKAVELIGAAQKITQFLDRDTNPNFAGPNGMQAFLLDFLKSPDQDLDKFLKKIQDFWDTL